MKPITGPNLPQEVADDTEHHFFHYKRWVDAYRELKRKGEKEVEKRKNARSVTPEIEHMRKEECCRIHLPT